MLSFIELPHTDDDLGADLRQRSVAVNECVTSFDLFKDACGNVVGKVPAMDTAVVVVVVVGGNLRGGGTKVVVDWSTFQTRAKWEAP